MTLTPPTIKQVPGSPANAYPTRNGIKFEGIVIHTMAGTLAGCDAWFANPVAQAGTHFGIGRAGEVHQYFSFDQGPFAHGKVEAGATAKLLSENPGINPNLYLIGIEHDDEGRGSLPTPAQLDASARLSAWLWQSVILPAGATNLLLDRNHILGHYEISPLSRPNCPGWGPVALKDYVARMTRLLTEPAPDPQPTLCQVQLGLIRKVLDEDWTALARDAAKLGG